MSSTLVLLAVLFFGVAALYASVGFGGGSAYLALLTLFSVPLFEAGSVALVCNLIVVAGGTWHYVRAGHFRADMVMPFLITSLPAAYIGGRWSAEMNVLDLVTGVALAIGAVVMIVSTERGESTRKSEVPRRVLWLVGLPTGALLGGLAGLIGMGGGVFLAPALYLLNWGTAKQVAAATSIFILANSIAGLTGRLFGQADVPGLISYGLLFITVFVAGQIGSRLGARRLPATWVRRITAVVLLLAAARLIVGM